MCAKRLAEFTPRTARINQIIFRRGVYVAKNTSRPASAKGAQSGRKPFGNEIEDFMPSAYSVKWTWVKM